jgi:acetylglutamate kinase
MKGQVKPLVLKLGGELIETAADRSRIAGMARALASGRPLAVVHGGGRAIDAELARRQIAPRKVEGLRVTDEATLDAVIAVLAGSANTDLVAALVAAGVPAVGLTGVDAGFGRATRSTAHQTSTGAIVDLGFVGDPANVDGALVSLLLRNGYVPVIASLGIEDAARTDGARTDVRSELQVLNVNADVMACRLAAALDGAELVIAGTTAGVLDGQGQLIGLLDAGGIDSMISSGTATAGMVAKLAACRTALRDGVSSVRILNGRALDESRALDEVPGTRLVLNAAASSVGV